MHARRRLLLTGLTAALLVVIVRGQTASEKNMFIDTPAGWKHPKTAWGVYPNLLIATTDPANSLTAFNAATIPYGLRLGLIWFPVGISLVIAYQVYVYHAFRGKVQLNPEP